MIYGPDGSGGNGIIPAGNERTIDGAKTSGDDFWPWLERNHATGGARQPEERNFWPWTDSPAPKALPAIPAREPGQSFWPWQSDTRNAETSLAPGQVPVARAAEGIVDALFAETESGPMAMPVAVAAVDSVEVSDLAWAGIVAGLFALHTVGQREDERREAARFVPRR